MKLRDIFFLAMIGAFLLALSGCTSKHEQPAPVTGVPALRNWSPEEECALARILGEYPEESVIWTLHDDWSRMRREIGLSQPRKPTFHNDGGTQCE